MSLGISSSKGNVLIMVLWILILITYLTGEYLFHNRDKASLVANSIDFLKYDQAVESVLHLFCADGWPIPQNKDRDNSTQTQEDVYGTWIELSPGGIDLKVKVEQESSKININTDSDDKIREKIRAILGEELLDQADEAVDSILDWKDEDDLVRLNGAEAEFYENSDLNWKPSNSSFTVLTELLLVRGVDYDLFWPQKLVFNEDDEQDKKDDDSEEDESETATSLLEAFTIYSQDVKRVYIFIPDKRVFIVGFIQNQSGKWKVLDILRTIKKQDAVESD